jgi:L-methionine (R)-S-oxide reductase
MAEDLKITGKTKEEKYRELLPQIRSLLENETDSVAMMANICAALKYSMDFFWVGFYLVKGKELVLGPFQGPVACNRIGFGRGVCGVAWEQRRCIIVPDVDRFPGHIACSSQSKSEIVLPFFTGSGAVAGVLDVDSESLNHFDLTDEKYLGQILEFIGS